MAPISVNIGGTYREMSDGWVNINGTWRQIDSIYTNIGGTWREGYSSGILLSNIPIGSIVYDANSWEHKTGDGLTGSGAIKPVEWIIVKKNHTGYPANSVTLISKELVGKDVFHDTADNYWGTCRLRTWLNGTFYNHLSSAFKNSILSTTLSMKTHSSSTYSSTSNVFLPSENEMGGNYTTSDGSSWGYFTSDASRIAKIGATDHYYWTRTPYSGLSDKVRQVYSTGLFSDYLARDNRFGIRPALNLKSGTKVELMPDGRYLIKG